MDNTEQTDIRVRKNISSFTCHDTMPLRGRSFSLAAIFSGSPEAIPSKNFRVVREIRIQRFTPSKPQRAIF